MRLDITELIPRALILILALGGLADALYFTFAYYGRIRKARWIPEILCARQGSNCVTVLQTPYARVFGVPNSLLGIFYYLLVIAVFGPGMNLLVNFGYKYRPLFILLRWPLTAMSAATVLLGFYLIYALRRKLGVDCPMCYTAHAINAALLVLFCWFSW
jgi:uncharacterized membrane protein